MNNINILSYQPKPFRICGFILFFNRLQNILRQEGGETVLRMTLNRGLVALNLESRVFNCIF
jgi:hypothetical protein